MWSNILIACIVMISISIVIGIILAIANTFFITKDDDRIEGIISALPGYDCGACGYVNCELLAKAIFSGEVRRKTACVVISKEGQDQLIDYCYSINDDTGQPIILK